jgi:YD repeat-containing protein
LCFFEKKQYKYSSSGKILAIKSTTPSKENEYYEYDEENRLVNKRKTDGYSTYYYRYDCDSQGRKIEERRCNGEFYDKICWEYDDKGRVLEEACYDREGKRYEHMSYKYNWQGRLVEENGENCYGFTESRKYHWRGRLKCPEGCRCKYDKHGNMIAKAHYMDYDTVVYRYKIVYR